MTITGNVGAKLSHERMLGRCHLRGSTGIRDVGGTLVTGSFVSVSKSAMSFGSPFVGL